MNIAQLRNNAQFHNVPFVRWRRQLGLSTALGDAPVDDIAGIVIDEVFFNTTDVIGHADYAFRALTGNHDVAFGGTPVLLAGDAKQKEPPTGEAAYKTLVRSAIDPTLRAKQQLASTAGLEILRRARKTDLTTIMRSIDDPAFTALQSRLRDTGHENPLSFDFLKSIPAVSTEDVAADAAWRFALIGVLSHRERDALNIAQLRNYAQFHNIPFVRWRRQLDLSTALGDAPVDDIYDNEPNLWEYFVEGATGLMMENVNPPRHLVNGTPCIYDHLRFPNDETPAALDTAYRSRRYCEVTLEEAPEALVMRVGCTPEVPYYWHEVLLPDLRGELVATTDSTDQLVVLTKAVKVDDVEITSAAAATHGVLPKLKTKSFPVMPAFALTDYKVQGRTLLKLIINMPARGRPPFMDLEAFYVLQSRVKLKKSLRFLRKDDEALAKLAKKRHNAYLYAWDHGYDEHGLWNDKLAAAAYEKAVALEEARRVAEQHRARRANYSAARTSGQLLASHHASREKRIATNAAEDSSPASRCRTTKPQERGRQNAQQTQAVAALNPPPSTTRKRRGTRSPSTREKKTGDPHAPTTTTATAGADSTSTPAPQTTAPQA